MAKPWMREDLEELGKEDLKAVARKLKITVGGTKAELIERIMENQPRLAAVPDIGAAPDPVEVTPDSPLAEPDRPPQPTSGLTTEQKQLVKMQHPEASPEDLAVFLYQAQRSGLDPVANQIYMVTRQGRTTVQTGIDGYRLIAARTGMMAGSDDPVFEGEIDEEQILGAGVRPVLATVAVYRIAADGQRYPYTATARWDEYAPELEAKPSFMWRKMPNLMLGKVAEALALRKAFPAELSGIYTEDEMAQSDNTLPEGHADELVQPIGDCPECAKHGEIVPVEDNRARKKAAKPGSPQSKMPYYTCSRKEKCREGSEYGWGTWELHYFDDVAGGGEVQTQLRPRMEGILEVPKATPWASARRWALIASQNDLDRAKVMWDAVLERNPALDGPTEDDFTAEMALAFEDTANEWLDEQEADFA